MSTDQPEDESQVGAPDTEAPDTEEEAGDAVAPGGGEPPELAAAAQPNPVRDRLLLPLVLPLLAMAAVALFVLNISRVFLAGGNGAASVIIAAIVTVAILAGAATISAMPQLRSSTLTMTVTLLVVVIMGAGLVTLGPSEEHGEGGEGGFQEPEGDANSTLEVEALGSIKFQSDEFTVPGGILEIDYVLGGGNHTLVFEEAEFAGFVLEVNSSMPEDSGKVEIAEGEYVIYCDIPGHREQGMEADLVITPAPPGAEGEPAPGGGEEPPPTDAP